MKKIICGLLLAALCLPLCACGITSSAAYPNADKYSIGSFTYDAASIDTVEINWTSGRVELTESGNDTLAVTETTEGLTQDQQMRWWQDGKTLRIQYWKSGYTGTLVNKEKRVMVEIPKDISLNVHVTSGEINAGDHQLTNVALQATSGEIKVGAVNAGDMTISLTSGSIQLGPVRVDKQLSVGFTSGNITIENAMADTVTVKSTSGDFKAGPIDANSFQLESTSGKITLDALKANTAKLRSTSGGIALGVYQCGKVDVNCTSGDIKLSVVHGSGATVNFKTNSGSLNGKSDKKTWQQVIGDGSSEVNINTTSGDLTVSEQ